MDKLHNELIVVLETYIIFLEKAVDTGSSMTIARGYNPFTKVDIDRGIWLREQIKLAKLKLTQKEPNY